MPYEQLCNMQVLMHNNAKTAQIEKRGHQICLAFCAILYWDILGHEFFRDLCDFKAELQEKTLAIMHLFMRFVAQRSQSTK